MAAPASNPLLDPRDVELWLHRCGRLPVALTWPSLADHDLASCELFVAGARRLAREALFPAFRELDAHPSELVAGRVHAPAAMHQLWPKLVELGVLGAARPQAAGGGGLPLVASVAAHAWLMAANGAAAGYAMLTSGAAHLIEVFGDDAVRARFLEPMLTGVATGTMALTEPHAGSSLAQLTTQARPLGDGRYAIKGQKIFISGGDHDLTPQIVHLTLARIEGAPAGTRGISLFAVPSVRESEAGGWQSNDVSPAGVVHKIGWRGIPSVILSYGERDDCVGWLVGERDQGLAHMFQMMNEARIMVGLQGAATAMVAYHEAVAYARERVQGRPPGRGGGPTPIIEHDDVRRMLLRHKAIAEGAMALLHRVAHYADAAEHAPDPAERTRAALLLDLLTPIAKSFPAEWGFEANTLAVQVHGGYGYSSEYLPEAWLREQKLNSLHEGTTGIQALDLLGRKVVQADGAGLRALIAEIDATLAQAREHELPGVWIDALAHAARELAQTTMVLAQLGAGGDARAMLRHASHYLHACCVIVVGWQWLDLAIAASDALRAGERDADYWHGKLAAAQLWLMQELGRVPHWLALCRTGEDAYARCEPQWL